MAITLLKRSLLREYFLRRYGVEATAKATGVCLATVQGYFQKFTAGIVVRLKPKPSSRVAEHPHWPAPYTGPDWIGKPIGKPPERSGPGWIGKPA